MPYDREAVTKIIQNAVDIGRQQVEIEIERRIRAAKREGYSQGVHEAEHAYANVDKVIGAAFLVGVAIGVVLSIMFGGAVAGWVS